MTEFLAWVMLVAVGPSAIAVPGSYLTKEECLEAVRQAVVVAAPADGVIERPAARESGNFYCVPITLP